MSPVRFLVAPHRKSRSGKLERLSFFCTYMKKSLVQFFNSPVDLAKVIAEAAAKDQSKVIILTDDNVSEYCLPLILPVLNELCTSVEVIEVEAGEASKNINFLGHLWTQLLESHVEKKDLIINLGGGVVCDLGGFAAATYKRGMNFFQVPTSLLAMVDAAIGGKNGIDHDGMKNAVGTLSSPNGILVYRKFIETLPQKQLVSGFAEMLKHALIADALQWERLTGISGLTSKSLMPFIKPSIRIKEKIISRDLRESGERKLLNFGHTIGHAIESFYLENQKDLTHGEAIAIGMQIETFIAFQLGKIKEHDFHLITNGLSNFFPYSQYEIPSFDMLLPYLRNDKKNFNGEFRMTLPVNLGRAEFDITVTEAALRKVMS